MSAPERIWVEPDNPDWEGYGNISLEGVGAEYVRADLYEKLLQQHEQLLGEVGWRNGATQEQKGYEVRTSQ